MQASRCPTPAIRVLVADSSPIHSQLLGEALRKDRRIKVVCAVAKSSDVMQGIVEHRPDILLISSRLDEQPGRGLDLLAQLRSSHCPTKAVVLLDSSKPEIIVRAFRVGARGLFCRNEPVKALCKCICVVHDGQVWANGERLLVALEALAAAPAMPCWDASGTALITQRESDVVRCLSEGLRNREIAHQLNISQHTVKNHMFRIFDKLGVSSRVELLFYFLRRNQAGSTLTNPSGGPQNSRNAA